jgi:hypothetical protein
VYLNTAPAQRPEGVAGSEEVLLGEEVSTTVSARGRIRIVNLGCRALAHLLREQERIQ